MSGKRGFAQWASVDHGSGEVCIDGLPLPYHVEPDPEVANVEGMVNVLRIGIFVDGPVVIVPRGSSSPELVDPVLGPVGEYARNLVRKGLLEEFPWIRA